MLSNVLRRRGAIVGAAWGVTGVLVACLGDDPGGQASPGDGGSDGAASSLFDASLPRDCSVYYVATGGNDIESGCDPARPKKTLAAAAARAKEDGVPGRSVYVCRGTYEESPTFVLDYPVSVIGGFSCDTWQPGDDPNQTIIRSGAAGLNVGGGVGRETVITNVALEGGENTEFSWGLNLDRSSPTIRRCSVRARATGTRSIGVRVFGGSPEITTSWIDGGSGKGGSVGILVASNTADVMRPLIHENVVNGGSAELVGADRLAASVAIDLSDAAELVGPNAIVKNSLVGGTGTADSTDKLASAAITIAGSATADITDNQISGGTGPGHRAGIYDRSDGTVRISKNRISGGVQQRVENPSGLYAAVEIDPGNAPASFHELTNNMIMGGQVVEKDTALVYGVIVFGSGAVVVRHNTIHVHPDARFGAAIAVPSTRTKLTMELNIFATQSASGSLDRAGVAVGSCEAKTLERIEKNLFVSTTPLVKFDVPVDAGPIDTGDAGAGCALVPPAKAGELAQWDDAGAYLGNLLLGPCGLGDPDCVATCSSRRLNGCLQEYLFENDGTFTANAELERGFRLSPSSDGGCRIAKAPAADGGVTEDFYGAPRTAPGVSMGAHEQENCVP